MLVENPNRNSVLCKQIKQLSNNYDRDKNTADDSMKYEYEEYDDGDDLNL